MKLLLFLLISFFAYGQTTVFTEDFSNYYPSLSAYDSSHASWGVWDSTEHANTPTDSLDNNLFPAGDDFDFLFPAFADSVSAAYDSLTTSLGNPLSTTGVALNFDNTAGSHIRGNNATSFNEPRTGDASWAGVFYNDGENNTQGVFGKGGNNATTNIGYQVVKTSTTSLQFLVSDGSGTFVTNFNGTMRSPGWNSFVVRWDRSDGIRVHVNGVAVDSTIAANVVDITNNGWFLYIGKDGGNGNNFNSAQALTVFIKSAFSKREAKEFGFLPNGWISQNGSVTRATTSTSWEFYQSLSDTIAGAITTSGTLADNEEWYVTLEAKSDASNKTMSAWLTGGTASSVTLTPTWSVYTLPLGRISIDAVADSLHIASANASSEIDIDNISVFSGRHHLINRSDYGEF